jgi:hypothetical protein
MDRGSVFGDRTMPSSADRSSSVNSIGVACWMVTHPLNHDSSSSDSQYEPKGLPEIGATGLIAALAVSVPISA